MNIMFRMNNGSIGADKVNGTRKDFSVFTMGYVGLIIAIFGMSVVQLLIKYRFNVEHGPTPTDRTLIPYISRLIFDPWLWLSAAILVFQLFCGISRFPDYP